MVIIHSSLLDGVNELTMSSHQLVTQFHPRFYIPDAKPVKLLCSLWQFITPCHIQIEWHCLSSTSQVVSIRARCWVWHGHQSRKGRTQATASPRALSFLLYLQFSSSLNAFPKCFQTSWTPSYFMKHRTFSTLCFLPLFTSSQSLKESFTYTVSNSSGCSTFQPPKPLSSILLMTKYNLNLTV